VRKKRDNMYSPVLQEPQKKKNRVIGTSSGKEADRQPQSPAKKKKKQHKTPNKKKSNRERKKRRTAGLERLLRSSVTPETNKRRDGGEKGKTPSKDIW